MTHRKTQKRRGRKFDIHSLASKFSYSTNHLHTGGHKKRRSRRKRRKKRRTRKKRRRKHRKRKKIKKGVCIFQYNIEKNNY